MFVRYLGINDKFLSIISQSFFCVFEFTVVEPLVANWFPDLCGELDGSFESCSSAFYMDEIILLYTCKGFRNKTKKCRWLADAEDVIMKS